MSRQKKTRPSLQASGRAHQSTASIPQRRLTDEEWAEAQTEMGPVLVAGFSVFFFLLLIL